MTDVCTIIDECATMAKRLSCLYNKAHPDVVKDISVNVEPSVVFSRSGTQYLVKIHLLDVINGVRSVDNFIEAFNVSYWEALESLHHQLSACLDKAESLDGEVKEIEGRKYKLTLVDESEV